MDRMHCVPLRVGGLVMLGRLTALTERGPAVKQVARSPDVVDLACLPDALTVVGSGRVRGSVHVHRLRLALRLGLESLRAEEADRVREWVAGAAVRRLGDRGPCS